VDCAGSRFPRARVRVPGTARRISPGRTSSYAGPAEYGGTGGEEEPSRTERCHDLLWLRVRHDIASQERGDQLAPGGAVYGIPRLPTPRAFGPTDRPTVRARVVL